MARKRNGLTPIGEVFGGLEGPVKAVRDDSLQAGILSPWPIK